ncbi:MAG TPA: cystathionine gamma-synthase family protein [Longimicrobiales bacterium]
MKKPAGKLEIGGRRLHPESLMMTYGYDPRLSEGALKSPIFQTSTFVFESAEAGKAFFELAYGLREKGPAEEPGLIYSRINNPDLEILEDRLSLWDGAESSLTFSSGMAAISTTLLTFLRPGDVIVHSEPIYGGTEFLVHNILPQFGVKRVGFLANEEGALERALDEARGQGRIGVIYVETPANPTNALVDIRRCADAAKALEADGRRPIVAVDNTFLGPLWQQPLRHGADLVLYSLTKYIAGHSDLIAGACLGPESLMSAVRGMRTILGTMADPWTGWLLMRSLETLSVRFRQQVQSAHAVAQYILSHPKVERVHYLGFLDESHPQYDIFKRQCSAAGATFSFEIRGGEAEAFRFLNALKLIKLAVSLGGTESLAEHPATMTHSDVPKDSQVRMGITPGMIRLSIGLEHPDDIIADLEQALDAI